MYAATSAFSSRSRCLWLRVNQAFGQGRLPVREQSSPGRDGRDEGSGNDAGTRPLWQLGGEPREHRTVSHRQLLQVSA